jgi:hypothetical protein
MGYKDDNYSSRVCNHHAETCTCRDFDINETPKQETLEDAKQRILDSNYMTLNDADIFEMGAKWQAKRMYSEEDLREAFKQSRQAKIFEEGMPPVYESFEEWFEQFRKK